MASSGGLREAEVAGNPVAQFLRWWDEARAVEAEPEAAALATASTAGAPSVRMVIVKDATDRGFVFYSDYTSRKGRELTANPRAALAFHWPALHRQVRVEGDVERLTREESAGYFRTRPVESRLSALASRQSRPIGSRGALEARVRRLAAAHPRGDVPLPDDWGGYVVRPEAVEFWQGRPGRLHDRLRYRRAGDGWILDRLQP